MWIPLETRTNFNKAKIFNKCFEQFTWAVADGPRSVLGFESCFCLILVSTRWVLNQIQCQQRNVWYACFYQVNGYHSLNQSFRFREELKTSLIIIGEKLFLTLKISVAKYCKCFIWTETDLFFCNIFSKLNCLS